MQKKLNRKKKMKKSKELQLRRDMVLLRSEQFLDAMVELCNGDPDKIVEGMEMFLAGVKVQSFLVKNKIRGGNKKSS